MLAWPLDHVVIAVRDLAQAVADYRTLGFHVLPGGEHPSPRTSHNALVVFADGAYLELIAWRGPPPGERWYDTLQRSGEGLVDFALLPQDAAASLAEARARGLDTLIGPVPGGRLRPDGQDVRWVTARHTTPDVAFLCSDITPRGLRVPDGGEDRRHPNGVTGVAGIDLVVHDIEASLQRYRALLGSGTPVPADYRLSEGLRSAVIPLQGLVVTLKSPAPEADQPGTEATRLRERLATRGEGPCALRLRTAATGTPGPLDASLTHGVDLVLATGA